MIIGVPREIKPGEQRVALTPAGARAMVEAAHAVLVERGAGTGSGIRDEEYAAVGAELASVDDVWRRKVDYLPGHSTPIQSLIEQLEFIRDKKQWGFIFRRGLFEISAADFERISEAMKV